MRRFILIALMAMLPLHFGWAAVAPYCGHESQTAGHFGHHEHEHKHQGHGQHLGAASADSALPDGVNGEASKLPGAADPDCAHCQCPGGGMFYAWAPLLSPRAASLAPQGPVPAPLWQRANRPERPQWLRLA